MIKPIIPPPLQAAKWLSIQVLIDLEEMRSLMEALGAFNIYSAQAVSSSLMSVSQFLVAYEDYINELKRGHLPSEERFRPFFSQFWTSEPLAIVTVNLSGKELARAVKPIVQVQYHSLSYSSLDDKFRSNVMDPQSFPWGVQFSYPQLFQEAGDQKVVKVDQTFTNTEFFQKLRRWVRENTVPVPFIVKEQKVNIPVRLGKNCFSWINNHPKLKMIGIKVKERDL